MTEPAELPKAEWKFDSVPDDEIEVCFVYEYARSATAFKKMVADWRAGHQNIIAAAEKLLKRKGPVGFTLGPTPETRKEAAFFAPSKPWTKADKRRADENGKAWSEWTKLSWEEGGYPGGFPLDDPRVFLFYFPPFPTKPWQAIDANYRRRAAPLLSSNSLFSGRFHRWVLLASKDFTNQMKAQGVIQAAAGAPMDKAALAASVRRQMEQHLQAPALIEYSEGHKAGLVGVLPPGFSWGKTKDQVCAEGFCRETVTFVVNWAQPDGEILKALKRWLKSPGKRPHKDFKAGSVTSAREHLRKLGAYRILASGVTAEQASARDTKTNRLIYLYQSPDENYRAKGHAKDLLKRMFLSADT